MQCSRIFTGAAVSLACLGLLFPQAELLASGTQRKAKAKKTEKVPIIDVALTGDGTVTGMVVDDRGVGLDGAVVSIRQGKSEVARTVTDKEGTFVAKNLRGGVYHIVGGRGSGLFRLWAPTTAPPAARRHALIVSANQVARAQLGPGLGGGLTFFELLEFGGLVTTITLGAVNFANTSKIKSDVKDIKAKSP